VFTVKGGKVVRHAIYWDNVRFMAQLGLMGSPEPAPDCLCTVTVGAFGVAAFCHLLTAVRYHGFEICR
jgi:hypothetical protein